MMKSKYNRLQLFLVFFLFAFSSSVSFFLLYKNPNSVKSGAGSFFFCCLGIIILLDFFRRSPRIIFDEEIITLKALFSTKTYLWKEIADVSLTTHEWYNALFLFTQKMEAMKFVLNDGEPLLIWSDKYQNTDALRSFVVRKLNDRLLFLSDAKSRKAVDPFFQRKYAGNAIITYNSLVFVGGLLFFFLLYVKAPLKNETILLLSMMFFMLFCYAMLLTQMHYFEIADGKLFIRNHFFPWIKKEYALNDIEEVNMETPYRRSKGLRILTYDFKSKFYGAGSLRKRHWQELMNALSSFGIKVPDKTI